jgi:hypothetical protein
MFTRGNYRPVLNDISEAQIMNNVVVNPQRKKPKLKPKREQGVTFTPLQRQVMEMHAVEGLTGATISKRLNKHESQVSRILCLPKVQEWLLSELGNKRGTAAMMGYNTVARLSQGAKSEYVQLEAAKDLLDRAGFKAPDVTRVEGDLRINIDLS